LGATTGRNGDNKIHTAHDTRSDFFRQGESRRSFFDRRHDDDAAKRGRLRNWPLERASHAKKWSFLSPPAKDEFARGGGNLRVSRWSKCDTVKLSERTAALDLVLRASAHHDTLSEQKAKLFQEAA